MMPSPYRGPMRFHRAAAVVLLAAASAMLGACGGGEDRSKAQIRLVNASVGHAALDLYDAQGRRLRADVPFGGDAGYAEVDPDDADLDVTRTGSTTPLARVAAALSEGERYSLVAYTSGNSVATVLVDDNVGAPDSGKVRLRVLNAAPDAGRLDIYLTDESADLPDAEPLIADAEAGSLSALLTADAATWRLRITAAGDRDDLRLDMPTLALASRDVVTLVLTPGAAGVLVDALVLVQRGAVTHLAGTAARVRAIAGVTDSGAVAARAGGVALLGGTGAPAIGGYRLVPAGAAAATASVDGLAITVPALALEAGRDYTLLVYGPASSATASWIADDNRLPSITGRARLRLAHGLAGVDDALAMTLDFRPVADGVAPGTASATTQVDAVSEGTLTVTAPGRGSAICQRNGQVLASASAYTLFVLGAEANAQCILSKDR